MQGTDRGERALAQVIAQSPSGGTWHVVRGELADIRSGFIVGGAGGTYTCGPGASEREVREACRGALVDAWEMGAAHVGWWTDARTGVLWLDVVDVVDDRDASLVLAADRGEIAVWDAAQGAEVRVGAA